MGVGTRENLFGRKVKKMLGGQALMCCRLKKFNKV